MNTSENHLHEFLRIFFANKRLIKRTFIYMAVLVLILPAFIKESYDISAQVVVQSKKLSQADASTSLNADTDKFVPPTLADMETESTMLRSPGLMRKTIEQMLQEGYFAPEDSLLNTWVKQPLKNYVITPLKTLIGSNAEKRDTRVENLTEMMLNSLNVVTLPGSNVVSVTYSSSDPTLAVDLVNRLLDNYMSIRQEMQSAEMPSAFYEQKRSQYQKQLQHLQQQRLDLLRDYNVSDPAVEISFNLQAINSEEQALSGLNDRLLESQHWLSYLQKNLDAMKKADLTQAAFPYTFSSTQNGLTYDDAEIRQLTTLLTTQINEYGDTTATFKSGSLPVKQQSDQIQRTRNQLLKVIANRIDERQNDIRVMQDVVTQKTSRVASYKERIHKLQDVQTQLDRLTTDLNALQTVYAAYTQRFEESRTQQVLDDQNASNAKILSRPFIPTQPSTPGALKVIISGLIAAAFLSLALGYIREFFDHRFKHPAQVQGKLQLPVLLVINDQTPAEVNPHKRGSIKWLRYWTSH
ncbi:hypothetical protein WH50_02200 [Pokkaliibacter plantistimulans]|uniref:Lipopolysaccharide biosynthesis protein n=1 Tax=Pokkaliibacter plantistimulans TaxID=1635171 RepID=A0ABX5M1R0_9GAMM|nr:lipopolysaccharide biosynthesis protein [Pokkaliibacter plantistimulans]PXF32861.1 hypothetical protein WH50_02200 [Pokkaliibacter plantistimulans]